MCKIADSDNDYDNSYIDNNNENNHNDNKQRFTELAATKARKYLVKTHTI